MISEKKKKKLKEDIEKKQYKLSLRPKLTPQERLWRFLNSNFGLWIISAVFLSSITTYLTNLNSDLKQEQNSKERSYKLLYEFGARYAEFYYLTNDNQVSKRLEKNINLYSERLFEVSAINQNSKLYNDFNNYNLSVIAFELEQLVINDSIKNEFRNFRHDINRLRRAYTLRVSDTTMVSTKSIANQTIDFRSEWGRLLSRFGYFGSLDTYLGYKPDFDKEEIDKLFGYEDTKFNRYASYIIAFVIILIIFKIYNKKVAGNSV